MAQTGITQITAEQFLAAVSARNPAAGVIYDELEFYSAADGWYLGVLIRDRTDGDFSYVVLAPDPAGSPRAIEFSDSIPSVDAARRSLLAEMGRAAAGGIRAHEQ